MGYDDVALFRGLFKRETGMSPAEHRAHFGPMAVWSQAREAEKRRRKTQKDDF